ncbi:unnamed protein product, partial [Polarella glacialis]
GTGQSKHLTQEQWHEKQALLADLRRDGTLLRHASAAWREDREVVLVAVAQNGLALRAEPEVVMLAVRQNGLALQYAAEALRKDYAVVQAAARQNADSLHYAAPELKHTDLKELRLAERARRCRHADVALQVAALSQCCCGGCCCCCCCSCSCSCCSCCSCCCHLSVFGVRCFES